MGSGEVARGSEERYAVQICDFPEVERRGRPVSRYFPFPMVLPDSLILGAEEEEGLMKLKRPGLVFSSVALGVEEDAFLFLVLLLDLSLDLPPF